LGQKINEGNRFYRRRYRRVQNCLMRFGARWAEGALDLMML
jgi:hypothetical protein